MPLITVYSSSEPLSEEKSAAFLRDVSSTIARELKKPEAVTMTCLVPRTPMTFGGSSKPACAVEVKSIGGLTPDSAKRVSGALGMLVQTHMGVPKNRTFIVFADIPAHFWGVDGSTVG